VTISVNVKPKTTTNCQMRRFTPFNYTAFG
jgi:hypothetical protein